MRHENENSASAFQFQFPEFPPEPDVEKRANLRLVQILALAPPGAHALGRVETLGRAYLSTVDVKSPYREFTERAVGVTPAAAIERVLNRIEDRLYQWRFGGGGGEASAQASHRMNIPQAQG